MIQVHEEQLYEKRVVAYIDILGFRSHIDRSVTDVNHAKAIRRVLQYLDNIRIDDRRSSLSLHAIDIQTSTFSDHIVRSTPLEMASSVFWTILDVIHFQMDLLAHGFLARGAITTGLLFHQEDVVFGPALVEAYNMESERAIFPRVILTEETIELGVRHCLGHGPVYERESLMGMLKAADDGVFYLNFLAQSMEFNSNSAYLIWLEQARNIIVNQLNTTLSDRVREKYEWIKQEFNEQLGSMQGNHVVEDGHEISIGADWLIS